MITNAATRLLLAVAALAAVTHAAPHSALESYFAKQLGVHPSKLGKHLLARAKSAVEKGQRATPALRAAAADDSKDYAVTYMYTTSNCTSDPVMAMAIRADACFNAGSGAEALSYYTSCVSGEGLTMLIYLGKNCKESNLIAEVPFYPEATCTDSLGDDDGDDGDDDDDYDDDSFDVPTYFSMECTNNIRQQFTNGPAMATYVGPNCPGDWFQAIMYPEEGCLAVDDSHAYSSVCGAGSLDIALYNSTTCTGEADVDHFTVGVCQNDEDTDDDDYDDDYYNDDDDPSLDRATPPAASTTCPSDSAASLPMMANWTLLLVGAILGLQLAAF